MVHSFENVCEIIPDRAREGLEKSLVGAVYEEEKKKKLRRKSNPGDLKKYLNWNKSLNS